jgi:tripartite-type tricarboxylate transporter receptor subunit TctC
MTEVSKQKITVKFIVIRIMIWAAIIALAILPFWAAKNNKQSEYPLKPIEIVVPFKAGGGSDVLVRMFQKTITKNKLLPVPLIVVNRPGASATDGSRFVKDTEPDGYTLLNLHDAIIISKQFGKVDYGPEAFEPVAGTVSNGIVVVVKESSAYKSFGDLIEDAIKRPSQVIFGCAMGTPTHVSGLLIQKEANIEFNLIQSGGGAARLEQLMGAHIDVSVFTVAEFLKFKTQGMKALAYLGEERHPDLPSLKTAKELGINAVADVTQFWWFPKGTDQKKVKKIAAVFKKALEDEELLAYLRNNKMSPVFYTGKELVGYLQKLETKISSLETKTRELPPFHLIVSGTVLVFLLYIVCDTILKMKRKKWSASEPLNIKPALVTIGLICLYIFLMGSGLLDFRVLTFIFMMTLGLFLSDKKILNRTVLIECSLVISLGVYYVFTNIVHVDLP